MRAGYWYVSGADGLHCCWAKSPSYSCPFANGIDDPEIVPVTSRLLPAIAETGMSVERVSRAVKRVHSSSNLRARVDGKLTEHCAACGAKLTRHGFAAWLERELPDDAELTPSQRISEGIFGTAPTERVGEQRYFRTKRKAEEWARKQAAKSRAAAA